MRRTEEVHCHTLYGHGSSTVEEMVTKAAEIGLEGITITEHGWKHYWCRQMSVDTYRSIRREIDEMQKKYPQLSIKMGIEANILGDSGLLDIPEEVLPLLDVINFGHHQLTMHPQFKDYMRFPVRNFLARTFELKKLNEKAKILNTEAIIRVFERYPIHMLTHPDSGYSVDLDLLGKACEAHQVLLEINNARGKVSVSDINVLKKYDVKFAVGTDAHEAKTLENWDRARSIIVESGLPLDRVVNVVED